MCDDWLRDGTTTNRIPNTPTADANPEFGRHESYAYYHACETRQRNKGLFTASQNLDGNTAIHTRQNPNGNRHGFECPEERDYYPYWHPTPWMDIAIFTDNMTRCTTFFQKESQNVMNKGSCWNETDPTQPIDTINNQAACEDLRHVWKETGAWNIAPPQCVLAPWTRDNHLGNTFGGETSAWNWTVPDHIHERCALRLRYNISTDDYDSWNTNASFNDQNGLKLDLAARFKSENPYPFKNNPTVNIGNGLDLELAINTAQYGRTFQDRSHRFSIRQRPDYVPADAKIYSVAVRGRRGNIVQTFPATEYDFAPNQLYLNTDDYMHIIWTGSNTNPNDAGEGRRQSDRSNIVPIKDLGHVKPLHLHNQSMFNDTFSTGDRPDNPRHVLEFYSTTGTNNGQYGGELSQLNDAATFFDGHLLQIRSAGTYHYMSTRNNNFSNRQQKATMYVSSNNNGISTGALIGIIIAAVVGLILLGVAAFLASVYFFKQRTASYSQLVQTPADPNGMYMAPE
jgi:hypothetical protein